MASGCMRHDEKNYITYKLFSLAKAFISGGARTQHICIQTTGKGYGKCVDENTCDVCINTFTVQTGKSGR